MHKKASQGKARQTQARQGKTRQNKTRQGKSRHNKARQDKKEIQNKTREGKTKKRTDFLFNPQVHIHLSSNLLAKQGKAMQCRLNPSIEGRGVLGRREGMLSCCVFSCLVKAKGRGQVNGKSKR